MLPQNWLPDDFKGWTYTGDVIDDHVHVSLTPSLEKFLAAANFFNVKRVGAVSRKPIGLKEFKDDRITLELVHFFSGRLEYANKKTEKFLNKVTKIRKNGIKFIKFWFATPYFLTGKDLTTPGTIKFFQKIGEEGLVAEVHISNPDSWHGHISIKNEIRRQMLEVVEKCPGTKFILVHMGGNPEDPNNLMDSLERYENLYLDTSATKWVSRELSAHHDDAKKMFTKYPDRILFGSDLVIPPHNQGDLTEMEYFLSRYFVQRMMLEYNGEFVSPIKDPDNVDNHPLKGLDLSEDILEKVYKTNAEALGF